MQVNEALEALRAKATPKDLANLARFGITAKNPLGVSLANIQAIAKKIGIDHELALALWRTEIYEARLLCAFIDDAGAVSAAQMDRWCREFDNWGVVDTLCFKLFDRTQAAWTMVPKWARRKPEYERRAAFALLASLAGHDKRATEERFLDCLPLIEAASTDERNFVIKGVSWALRRMGSRGPKLHQACVKLARELAESESKSARWLGRDALRDLEKTKRIR
jgi:3-methyladenine DNA glycosylase AlkD